MKSLRPKPRFPACLAAMLALAIAPSGFAAVDPVAAEALLRKNNCPSYREVAQKYKGKDRGEAETRLVTHITTGEKAKFPDGHEEDHKIIKTKDMDEIRNGINWILSQ
jgi:cytochrome c